MVLLSWFDILVISESSSLLFCVLLSEKKRNLKKNSIYLRYQYPLKNLNVHITTILCYHLVLFLETYPYFL